MTTSMLSRFQARLREEGIRDTTIATHLRHLKAAFSWAVTVELLAECARVQIPKRSKGLSLMRGRPITDLEFAKLLKQVPTVRPKDAALWERYLRGLWLSGLRLEESVILSWDEEAPFSVDLSGRRPRFRIYAEAEKGHCDRLLPMTPDFAQFLLQTPAPDRHGHVFKLPGLLSGKQMTSARVGRVISAIGNDLAEVLDIHCDQIGRHGGREGIRDLELLQSALAVPAASFAGRFLHQDLPEMAAAFLFHIVRDHPFIDGNKRTGAVAALVFLLLNGCNFAAPKRDWSRPSWPSLPEK